MKRQQKMGEWRGLRVRIGPETMGEGREAVALGAPVFVRQDWLPVKFDDEEDPTFFKLDCLEFESSQSTGDRAAQGVITSAGREPEPAGTVDREAIATGLGGDRNLVGKAKDSPAPARVAELEAERNAIDKRRGELSECLSSIRLDFLAGSRGNAMSREWAEWMAEVVGRVLNGSSMESAEAESERHAGALP